MRRACTCVGGEGGWSGGLDLREEGRIGGRKRGRIRSDLLRDCNPSALEPWSDVRAHHAYISKSYVFNFLIIPKIAG